MTDAFAAWAAAHALQLFLALPLLAGAAAYVFARCGLGLPGRRRTIFFMTGTCAALALFLVLAFAIESEGVVVAFDRALASSLSMSMSTP
ncbi:hypothetical protein V2J61_07315, partial [Pseudomonas aeruginosa]|nr:hypothetical protein [Pseudomonas aeruginosa]